MAPATALVRFLLRGAPTHAFYFAHSGRAVAPLLASSLRAAAAPPGAPGAAALAADFSARAAALAPAGAPATASTAIDFRFDVACDGAALHVELREWTNDTPTFTGDAAALARLADAGFGQC